MGLMRLGLSNPAANTDIAIYTATGPFLASIIATNKSASVTANVRMWIVPSGATITSQYAYLAYDQDIVPQNTLETHRFALNQNDVVYVRADTADMSFMINGLKQVDIALAAGVTSYSNTPPLDVMDGMIWVDKDGNGTALNTLAGQVIQSNAITQTPLTLQGASGQTADLLDIKNSSGTDLVSVSSSGNINTSGIIQQSGNTIVQFVNLTTPVIHEVSFTGTVNTSLSLNTAIPLDARFILADVFITSATSDHQNFEMGNVAPGTVKNWIDTRGSQPSLQFGNLQRQTVIMTSPGEVDGYSSNYGLWFSSQIIPITNRTLFYGNFGNSGSNGWVYWRIRGYSK
jgi:hypothetical protein